MTSTEAVVIIGGLVLGYWLVSSVIGNDSRRPSEQKFESTGEAEPKEEIIEDSWFQILEISPNASKEEIVSAYKQKIRQYHPDKVVGLGSELRELAEIKSKQINTAYDYALKLKG